MAERAQRRDTTPELLTIVKLRELLLPEIPTRSAAEESHLANLFAEFADEDRELADEGLDEYAKVLAAEDVR